eukprot:CAMPEP_0205878650 /NCGR_PEP_ID=MMETSP1083-20121108/14967_1 /ASSEMBLY_ACC=CAM_ASM_000430 /TAXON_ID=97485 /ORGANISM="Prymnesium parvum, Strain Texoma1" /LENGTH=134 /DNA_ID=CAMNT_0053241537 /DNA_START=668 /DNA_END=1068 /DNA_ORIENTATION=-
MLAAEGDEGVLQLRRQLVEEALRHLDLLLALSATLSVDVGRLLKVLISHLLSDARHVLDGGIPEKQVQQGADRTCEQVLFARACSATYLNIRMRMSMQPKLDSTLSLVTCAPTVLLCAVGSLPTAKLPSLFSST